MRRQTEDRTIEAVVGLEPDQIAVLFRRPRGRPLVEVREATRRALAEPVGFPPLVQATVPGDRIVIALNSGVPATGEIVAGLIETLIEGGRSPGDITILRTASDAASRRRDPLAGLPENIRGEVTVVIHDPAERTALGYLAATEAGDPIYLNRAIFDADLVIPVGVVRSPLTLGYSGPQGGLFPAFADEKAQQRFRAAEWCDSRKEGKARTAESNEATWLVGSPVLVQVVPGGGDKVLHVIAGSPAAVAERGEELFARAWRIRAPAASDLVIVGLDGGSDQQTWDNLARALAIGLTLVEEDGAIVLWTTLDQPPGPALGILLDSAVDEEATRAIRRQRGPDTIAAQELLVARQRVRIFLKSRLTDDLVIGLGLTPIADAADIAHLAEQYQRIAVVAHAQYAVPVLRTASRKHKERRDG
jgi:nickel-dependent lactate racemase